MANAFRALLDWRRSLALEVKSEDSEAEEKVEMRADLCPTEEREKADADPVVRRAIAREAWIRVTMILSSEEEACCVLWSEGGEL